MDSEPMSLGSPQQGQSAFPAGKTQSSFLPSYLIGSNAATPTAARSLQAAVSPKNVTFQSNNQLVKPRVPIDKHDGKTNAPPVSALNSLFSPQSPQGKSRPFVGSATILHNSHAEFDTRENGEMLQSPTQLDPFFQEGGEGGADPTWVTIFGFPTAAESFILRQFRQYGIILQYVSQHNQANWIHIQYKTKLQARKALSKNGKIIQGQIMIGVVPCVKEPANTIQSPERASVLEPITNLSFGNNQRTQSDSMINTTVQKGTPNRTFSGMRRMNSLANTTLNDSTHTPQKDASYIGKTMSYIFGEW